MSYCMRRFGSSVVLWASLFCVCCNKTSTPAPLKSESAPVRRQAPVPANTNAVPPANPALAKAEASDGSAEQSSLQASQGISYSPPSAFVQLPLKIQSELQSRGCQIPRPYTGTANANVIRGQFARRGQTDWAVLCSKEKISSILVFWNGSETTPAEIDPAPDGNFLTPLENGKAGYARAIAPVGNQFIMTHFKAYGGPQPPPIDHEGIDDEFLEKGSTVHYFYEGQWLELTGSD
jgi:hypothetical protein